MSSSTSSSKVSVSPSFKGNITNIMRQRQLFLDATRAAASTSHSGGSGTGTCTGMFTRLWKRVSGLEQGLSIGVGVAIGLAISTHSSSALRCIPTGFYSPAAYSSYAWTVAVGRAALDKLIDVNSLVFMGLTSTVISAVILSAFILPGSGSGPFQSLREFGRRRRIPASSAGSAGSESGSGSGSDDTTTFESLFYEEYDAMMMLPETGTGAGTEPASFSAVPVTTPRCELVVTYVPARSAFGYYTDRKDSIPYSHLETAARMFLVKNARPDLAKLAYVDRRPTAAPVVAAPVVAATVVATATDTTDTSGGGTSSGGGIFAMFKSYNRKPGAAATPADTSADAGKATAGNAKATDTHFVYLGTLQDYKATRDKGNRSPTSNGSGSGSSVGGEDAPYVNVKYAEFKSRSKL